MQDFGVTIESLVFLQPPVKGRVLHIDADFLAYHVAHDDSEPWESMVASVQKQTSDLMHGARAESVYMHLTSRYSDKGGRYQQARQKEYQGNRKDKPIPKYLENMRVYLANAYPGTAYTDREADDGLCQSNWNAILKGERDKSVIVSKDKDLRQCQGLQMDWSTHEITDVDGFGSLYLQDGKLLGYGNKFFWAQMLMGDTADNIQGLPYVYQEAVNWYKPTKASDNLDCKIMGGCLKSTQRYLERSKANCGPMMTFSILNGVNDNSEAFNRVLDLYSGVDEFKHWRTGEVITAKEALYSEMMLLWMRRTDTTSDIFKHCTESYT